MVMEQWLEDWLDHPGYSERRVYQLVGAVEVIESTVMRLGQSVFGYVAEARGWKL